MTPQKIVYVIAGPTAVGKTAVAIALAKSLGTAIVSADSRQCYREMSIGTAKPSAIELQQVPHYFISTHTVTEALTAGDYEKLSLGYLDEIFQDRDAAVVCGGTGLYIKALCQGLDEMPDIDEAIATEVDIAYKANGLTWLQAAVQEEDPEYSQTGEMQNPARLLRALIFKRSTGTSITAFRSGVQKERPFRIIKTALELPREILYQRINQRVDFMMKEGLLDEVTTLYPLKQLKNLQTVGYTELFEYLAGDCSLNEAVEKIKQHTRNYAKRQMTWFSKDKDMHWLRADDKEVLTQIERLGNAQ